MRCDIHAFYGTRARGRRNLARSMPQGAGALLRRRAYRTMTGRTIHTAPPATVCLDVLDWCGSVLVRAACAGSLSRACQAVPTFLAASASPSGPGAPGVGAEVAGLLDPGAAFCLDLVVPGDVQAAARTVAGVKFPGFDPVVNDASAAAQAVGGFCDADLLG